MQGSYFTFVETLETRFIWRYTYFKGRTTEVLNTAHETVKVKVALFKTLHTAKHKTIWNQYTFVHLLYCSGIHIVSYYILFLLLCNALLLFSLQRKLNLRIFILQYLFFSIYFFHLFFIGSGQMEIDKNSSAVKEKKKNFWAKD